jgi:hypothetical protein
VVSQNEKEFVYKELNIYNVLFKTKKKCLQELKKFKLKETVLKIKHN